MKSKIKALFFLIVAMGLLRVAAGRGNGALTKLISGKKNPAKVVMEFRGTRGSVTA